MLQREELELLRWRISFIGYVIVAALLVLAFWFLERADRSSPATTSNGPNRIAFAKFRCLRRAAEFTIAIIGSLPTTVLPTTSF